MGLEHIPVVKFFDLKTRKFLVVPDDNDVRDITPTAALLFQRLECYIAEDKTAGAKIFNAARLCDLELCHIEADRLVIPVRD